MSALSCVGPTDEPGAKNRTIKLYKLHGSLHFHNTQGIKIKLKQRPYTGQFGDLKFTIIPPETNKLMTKAFLLGFGIRRGQALHRAKTLVVVGYSFPLSDLHATVLFRVSIRKGGLKTLVLVNPDRSARRRARDVLKRGTSNKTRVLVFDKFEEFAAVERALWEA
jgi:hypothetical protein